MRATRILNEALRTVALVAVLVTPAIAADMPKLDPNDPRAKDRLALRDMLVGAERALNKLDVEAMIELLTDDAVVVWVDNNRTLGKSELREYHKRMVGGAGALLKSIEVKATLDGPARFHGEDSIVAFGSTKESYELVGGTKVTIDGKWTAVCVKVDGKWKAASMHFSTNPFDNDISRQAAKLSWVFGAGGIIAGLVLGWLAARLMRRK